MKIVLTIGIHIIQFGSTVAVEHRESRGDQVQMMKLIKCKRKPQAKGKRTQGGCKDNRLLAFGISSK
jgi:hypothetical protein